MMIKECIKNKIECETVKVSNLHTPDYKIIHIAWVDLDKTHYIKMSLDSDIDTTVFVRLHRYEYVIEEFSIPLETIYDFQEEFQKGFKKLLTNGKKYATI